VTLSLIFLSFSSFDDKGRKIERKGKRKTDRESPGLRLAPNWERVPAGWFFLGLNDPPQRRAVMEGERNAGG
jgi:hypothetical protein